MKPERPKQVYHMITQHLYLFSSTTQRDDNWPWEVLSGVSKHVSTVLGGGHVTSTCEFSTRRGPRHNKVESRVRLFHTELHTHLETAQNWGKQRGIAVKNRSKNIIVAIVILNTRKFTKNVVLHIAELPTPSEKRGVFLRIFEEKEFAKNKRSFVILTGRGRMTNNNKIN